MARAVLANWQLKLVAFALAATGWFFVASADRSEIAFAAPVEYLGLERDFVLIGHSRESVDVQVEAVRWALPRLTPASVRVRVDLGDLDEGEHSVRLLPDRVAAPPGVRVTRVAPAWLQVTLARAETKAVRVVPQIRGAPAPDHALHGVVVDPPTVKLRGPRSTIAARTTVETVPVDVSGSRQTVTQTVALVLPESVYATNESTVKVTVDIRPEEPMPRGRK